MAPIRPAIVILGCLIAGRLSFAQTPAQPASFAVAVHENETLLPLARYEQGRWLNTWPEPDEDSKPVPALKDIPVAWLGRPIPSEWTLWLVGGGTSPVRVTGTDRSGGCVVSPKLTLSETRFPPEGSFDQVHPGLATTDAAAVDGIEMLVGRSRSTRSTETEAILRRIEPAIAALFAAREREAIAADVNGDGKPNTSLTPARVAALTPQIDWLYRPHGTPDGVLYFEASKRTDATALESVTVRGWLVLGAAASPVTLGVDAYVAHDEELKAPDSLANVSTRIPLGVVRAGGRAFWFLEAPTGESGGFEVYDVAATSARRLLYVDAGGC